MLIGSAYYFFSPEEAERSQIIMAACYRLAPVLVLLWMAYPELERMPWWVWVVVPGTLLVLAWRPRLIPIAVPILILIGILRPRKKKAVRR